jgi:lipopolysaccharide export LptBFGC system permease protein LptF
VMSGLPLVAGLFLFVEFLLVFLNQQAYTYIHEPMYKTWNMQNQSGTIPDYLESTWKAVNDELHLASEEVRRVEILYQQAMLAKIALFESGADPETSSAWEIVTKRFDHVNVELQDVRGRYIAAVTARVKLTDAVNNPYSQSA